MRVGREERGKMVGEGWCESVEEVVVWYEEEVGGMGRERKREI